LFLFNTKMNQAQSTTRSEVMLQLGNNIETYTSEFLKSIESNWQPGELLPDSSSESFFEDIKTIQGQSENLSYDLLAVLIGDTITEEALPTYESWLVGMEGVNEQKSEGWMKWIRGWTSEENRHGDVLNKFLYLSGRVNMPKFEASVQYLLTDGFDIQTGNDPYKSFVYTSFQETATNISHRRVASLAKQSGNMALSKICGLVASDEARHAKAYKTFVEKIFEMDPSEMMLAFEDMMRKKIIMPAMYMRELGEKVNTFANFSDAAQRIGVYTSLDYIEVMQGLIKDWKIENMRHLNDEADKARDYIMSLPDRLSRIAERMRTPTIEHKFNWIIA
jgi:acyl-[acyl-carrier-protein] desaturase